MKAYVYLIGWSKHNLYYYGLRHARGCKTSDLLKGVYRTSSKKVQKFWKNNGPPDIIQIRKTFECIERAKVWEHKVLRRMKASKRKDFFNQTDNKALPIFFGEENPSKKNEVRNKIREKAKQRKQKDSTKEKIKKTKLIQYIIKVSRDNEYRELLRNKKRKDGKYLGSSTKFKYKQCLLYLEEERSNLKRLIQLFKNEISCIDEIIKNNIEKRREKISLAKKGKRWYHCPITKKCICVFPEEKPDGFIEGMIKNSPNKLSEAHKKRLSLSMKKVRQKESDQQKQLRLKKYYESISCRKENRVIVG